ncbi:amino acid adenylation domain-containing protein [Calothrix brevissima NIES-22]|nr:amino acid adenylation domain-containing protein [Calothrix brevissima NIES-22]
MSDNFFQRIQQLSPERRELLELLMQENNTEVQASYIAPENPTEKALSTIWSQVLGIKKVGIKDNFLELGGDSILSIQVIAKAHQIGLQFSTSQLFDHPTIAELAKVVSTTQIPVAQQKPIIGAVPLTPIQHWFFEQNFPEASYWNQAVLLELQPGQNPVLLEQACQQLLIHHDALRLRFEQKEQRWEQINEGIELKVPFLQIDLSKLTEIEQTAEIEKISTELQSSLNLSQAPLMQVAFFHLGNSKPNRLLLIFHHLTEDAVSLRIILEDLQTAYQQLLNGEVIKLPPKTTSFQQWSHLVTEYAQSAELKQELAYWLTQPQKLAPLPVDYPGGSNVEGSAQIVSVSLTAEETRALLQEVPKSYHTEINEVLLTAVVLAISQWTLIPNLLIDIEGHGREDIIPGVDLSRTVGFFTSVYPVNLNIVDKQNTVDILMSIKEQMRRIPKRGIGYGLLRYCCQDAITVEKLRALPQTEIIFNYLGQFDRVFSESSLFRLAKESHGATNSPQGNRSHLLQVIGKIMQGQLEVSWIYSENIHRRETVEKLAECFIHELRSLIYHNQSTDKLYLTPSDFPDAELTQAELSQLFLKS